MEQVSLKIGERLKEIRNTRQLTLDDVAELTGVSKPMLGQIERGQSSPTINILWKISTGLKIPLSFFCKQEETEYTVAGLDEKNVITEEDGGMRAYPLFPFDPVRNVEVFYISKGLEKLEMRFRTGNTVVDTLLNMKYHEAVRGMPDLRMDADKLLLPQGIQIHSYDIGVILGNAVDNAVEACRKLRAKEPGADVFIRISSLQKGNLLILKVENSFDGRLVRRRQEEFPVTDKADRKSHGIGLINIRSTAEKYQGTMDFKVNGRVFILSVMMKNERRD